MEHQFSIAYKNVKLRPLCEEDIEQVRVWRNKEENRKCFLDTREIDTENQKKWFQNYKTKPNDYMFVIEETEEIKEMVGAVAIYDINEEKGRAEYGRLFIGSQEVKGKGIAKLAAILCLHIGFKYLGLKEFYAEAYVNNLAAMKVHYNTGFLNAGIIQAPNGEAVQKLEVSKERFYELHSFLKEV